MPTTALGEESWELIVRWCGATMTCSMWTTIAFTSHGSETLVGLALLTPLRRLSPTSSSRLALIPRPRPIQGGGRRPAARLTNARSVTFAPPLPAFMGFKSRLIGPRLTTPASSLSLILAIGLALTTTGEQLAAFSHQGHPSQLCLGIPACLTSSCAETMVASTRLGGRRGKTGLESTTTGEQLAAFSHQGHRLRPWHARPITSICSSAAMTAGSTHRGGTWA